MNAVLLLSSEDSTCSSVFLWLRFFCKFPVVPTTLPVTETRFGRSMEQQGGGALIELSWRAEDVLMSPSPVFILTFEQLPYRCPSSQLKTNVWACRAAPQIFTSHRFPWHFKVFCCLILSVSPLISQRSLSFGSWIRLVFMPDELPKIHHSDMFLQSILMTDTFIMTKVHSKKDQYSKERRFDPLKGFLRKHTRSWMIKHFMVSYPVNNQEEM